MAEEFLKEAIITDPLFTLSYGGLGTFYYDRGLKENCIYYYSVFLKVYPYYKNKDTVLERIKECQELLKNQQQ